MLKMMQSGTVLVDVAIDQGGCFETSHPTTHSEPTYVVDGIVHYAVANIPGAVPYTSTLALTNATLPYVIALANMEKGMQGRSGAGFRSECGRRESGISSDSRCIRPEIRAIELRIKEFHHGVTEG